MQLMDHQSSPKETMPQEEEIREVIEPELVEGRTKEGESDDSSSPRGVLETTVSASSDSDNGNCESPLPVAEKSFAQRTLLLGDAKGLQFKGLIDGIKWKSMRRFSTIPLLYEIPVKSLRRKWRWTQSGDEEIDCSALMAPKPSWRNFTCAELATATDNFNPEKLVGKGGHAEVYKGCLPDGQIVAVKRITKKEKNDETRVGDFLSELGIIAHINHPNAAKLIGFSSDGGLHLILQFLPHGSLASLLHGGDKCLAWNIRYKVALGVAEGLQYLHCECQRRIIHRDITASNILLAQDYEPQISDFGLAKWLPEKWVHHVVHPIEGTFGYMAPEYFMHGIVDEKIDVFAFGVLLLELITGRRAVDSSQQSLAIWAKPLLENSQVKDMADPRLGDDYDSGEMKRVMSAALACLHHLPSHRPDMTRVVQLLREEGGQRELRQDSIGGRALIVEACDMEGYTSTSYINDLHRHMELVLE
ncbi:receptor-like cytosolic serine/threonine-protein kinase RBK1 [Diospyros lotus]|uniref:receptor-like cytosolic serine/threonine-protein kinase RBK1 n=1 Tax=Diospyros lotus TaxID=55363 RepID=UPI002251479E|nr:receptor-like cytosolic serine/threonine-protein kinase RBK1 [Diospyros lotus]